MTKYTYTVWVHHTGRAGSTNLVLEPAQFCKLAQFTSRRAAQAHLRLVRDTADQLFADYARTGRIASPGYTYHAPRPFMHLVDIFVMRREV